MKKIAKVITVCSECENCKHFISSRNNYTNVYICVVDAKEDEPKPTPFLLEYSEGSGLSKLLIPAICPLEDYESKT